MISEELLKYEFIARIGKEEFARLAAEQISILEDKRSILSGEYFTSTGKTIKRKGFDVDALISDVRNRKFNVSKTQNGLSISFDVLKKLRFADMKKLGNAQVYNKPLWGIIFGKRYSLLTRLQSEWTNNVRQKIIREALYKDGKFISGAKIRTLNYTDDVRSQLKDDVKTEIMTIEL